jgi:hypothetical protein
MSTTAFDTLGTLERGAETGKPASQPPATTAATQPAMTAPTVSPQQHPVLPPPPDPASQSSAPS